MRIVYFLLVHVLAPLYAAMLLWRGFRDRAYWRNFAERFGYGKGFEQDTIWVHAVSVGEVQAAAPLVRALRERSAGTPIVVTTGTPTGAARARALFGEDVHVRYVPFDLPGAVRRFFDRVRPRRAIVIETELWPHLYRECERRGIPLVLASARISERLLRHYRKLAPAFADVLARNVTIAAQTPDDAARFRSIGASAARTHVIGNLKFDLRVPPETAARGEALRAHYASRRPVWVAGSTHDGEEQQLLAAHRKLSQAHPDALLILVPRHPQRFAAVADWLKAEGVRFVRRSEDREPQGRAADSAPKGERSHDAEVVLVDTLGELLDFYAAGDVAFVGGSLVTVGGHNLLEPAALALPVLTGPHHFNGADIARLLIERGAVQVVRDADELAGRIGALLSDRAERARIGAIGRSVVEENRGALERLLALIEHRAA